MVYLVIFRIYKYLVYLYKYLVFLVGFLDVDFLPSGASTFTTFLNNCVRCEGLGITTCRKTVVGGKQGHAPTKILSL